MTDINKNIAVFSVWVALFFLAANHAVLGLVEAATSNPNTDIPTAVENITPWIYLLIIVSVVGAVWAYLKRGG